MRTPYKIGYSSGRQTGAAAGYYDGYALGRKEAVRRNVAQLVPPMRQLKIMYVAQGTPGFHTIDLGIASALRRQVSESFIVPQQEDAADIASRLRPDLVLVLNGIFNIPVDQVDRIRGMGIRTAVWIADDPYFTDELAGIVPHYDIVFTHESACVPFYQSIGCPHVHHLPFAAAPHVFYPKQVPPHIRYDVCFIGSAFPNRIAFFEQIVDGLAGLRLLIAGNGWNRMKGYEKIMHGVNLEGIQPEEANDVYNASRIVINLHRSHDEPVNSRRIQGSSPNPRTFDISATGTLQLTDVRPDLPGLYRPGEEVAFYQTPHEMLSAIHHYLQHEEERLHIALRGLRRTLAEHTYNERIARMLGVIFG